MDQMVLFVSGLDEASSSYIFGGGFSLLVLIQMTHFPKFFKIPKKACGRLKR